VVIIPDTGSGGEDETEYKYCNNQARISNDIQHDRLIFIFIFIRLTASCRGDPFSGKWCISCDPPRFHELRILSMQGPFSFGCSASS
jgi:hypothetical protein